MKTSGAPSSRPSAIRWPRAFVTTRPGPKRACAPAKIGHPLRVTLPVPRSLVASALSSLAAVALELLLLTLLVSVAHVHYLVAAALATAGYLIVHFVLSRFWAFRARAGCAVRQLARHAGVTAVGLGIVLALMRLCIDGIGLPYQAGWAVAGSVSFGLWTYPMSRFFTFRRHPPTPTPRLK